MAKATKTTLGYRRFFVQARRRALKRLRNGMDLGWSSSRSRDELHRKLGSGPADSSNAQRPLDARLSDETTEDQRE
jgi:hypothetical protein